MAFHTGGQFRAVRNGPADFTSPGPARTNRHEVRPRSPHRTDAGRGPLGGVFRGRRPPPCRPSPLETGGTSRPRPKSPTVDPSSRRPRGSRVLFRVARRSPRGRRRRSHQSRSSAPNGHQQASRPARGAARLALTDRARTTSHFSNHHPFPNHRSGRNAPGSAECSSRPIRQPMIGEASVKPPRCRRRALHAVTITHRLLRAGRTARRLSSSRQPVRHPHGASFCEARDGCQGLASSRRCAVPRRARETACNHPIPGAKNFLPAVQALSK